MKRNTVVVLLMLTLIILIGIPESFARPEYLANLTAVYGNGSCGTCHIRASGGGPRNSYGTLFENQPNFDIDPITALKAIGKPPASTVATPGATATLTAAAVTSVTARGTPAAAGFEFAFSLAGLLTCALLVRRHNK